MDKEKDCNKSYESHENALIAWSGQWVSRSIGVGCISNRRRTDVKKLMKISIATLSLLTLLSTAALSEQPWTDEENRAGIKKQDGTRYVPSGKSIALSFLIALRPDCSINEEYQFELIKEPEHGTVEFTPEWRNTSFSKENVRAKCNEKKSEGHVLSYRSASGYVGTDSFTLLELAGGWAWETTYHLNVRPSKP